MFQSTPPARRATPRRVLHDDPAEVSIHAPRAEGDRSHGDMMRPRGTFQSTPPARRATAAEPTRTTCSPTRVSIHAPRAEGDSSRFRRAAASSATFQSTPPARRATHRAGAVRRESLFQSTPPARRATCRRCGWWAWTRRFNPRPPRGGRQDDPTPLGIRQMFQSTPPARRATHPLADARVRFDVSIHAPRAEGDVDPDLHPRSLCSFNPRPPRGGRPAPAPRRSGRHRFNPRPPRGGRPAFRPRPCRCEGFNPRPPRGGRLDPRPHEVDHGEVSIHAPRAEGDHRSDRQHHRRRRFQSTPPARRATRVAGEHPLDRAVSIHAPRAEGDVVAASNVNALVMFQSTPPARRATRRPSPARRDRRFNPRPPRGGRRSRQAGGLLSLRFNPRPPRGGRPLAPAPPPRS